MSAINSCADLFAGVGGLPLMHTLFY